MTIKFFLIFAAVLACLGMGAAGAHWVDAKDYGQKLSVAAQALANEENAHQQDLREVASAGAVAASNALTREEALQAQIAAADTKHQQEIQDAQDANAQLARDVDSGAKRLRIVVAVAAAQADSLGGSHSMPHGAAGAGVGYESVDLAPEARQAYNDLRQSITDDQVKIAALQDYARSVSAVPPK